MTRRHRLTALLLCHGVAGCSDGDASTAAGAGGGAASSSSSAGGAPLEPALGLYAEYFAAYLDLALGRVESTLDADWMDGSPSDAVGADRFSARWTGFVTAPATGSYTIATETDDGVRVWIDDALVIDDWNGHFVTRNEATVELTAGNAVPIRVDYFEIDLAASIKLLWSSDAIAEEVIPTDVLTTFDAPTGLASPKPPYVNPVIPFDCPDPGVMFDGTTFYAVCTGGAFPIRSSRSLVFWNDTGTALLPAGKPAWAANGNRNWAPELHRVGDGLVAYFTSVDSADVLSIGAVHAPSVQGPWMEQPGPLDQHALGVIDATFFEDDDGSRWLIDKVDGNSQGQPTPIRIRRLAADGLAFEGTFVTILTNDSGSWEGGVVEAPWIVKRDGSYYLFYSGNVYDHRYRTGVARAAALTGPYEKHGTPILANNERWVGPGHGSVVSVSGKDYFVYHAWTNDGAGAHLLSAGRQVLVDRIVWSGGWPSISDGTPSRTPQPWPGD